MIFLLSQRELHLTLFYVSKLQLSLDLTQFISIVFEHLIVEFERLLRYYSLAGCHYVKHFCYPLDELWHARQGKQLNCFLLAQVEHLELLSQDSRLTELVREHRNIIFRLVQLHIELAHVLR